MRTISPLLRALPLGRTLLLAAALALPACADAGSAGPDAGPLTTSDAGTDLHPDGGVAPPHITVSVDTTPYQDVVVVHHDADGRFLATVPLSPDGEGRIDAPSPGAMVTVLAFDGSTRFLATVADVRPDETLRFGEPDFGRVEVSAVLPPMPPAATSAYRLHVGCGTAFGQLGNTRITSSVSARCLDGDGISATVAAQDDDARLLAYVTALDLPDVGSSPVDLSGEAWRYELGRVRLHVGNLDPGQARATVTSFRGASRLAVDTVRTSVAAGAGLDATLGMAALEADQWELTLALSTTWMLRETSVRSDEVPVSGSLTIIERDATVLLMDAFDVAVPWPLSTVSVDASGTPACEIAGAADMATFGTRALGDDGWYHWNIAVPGDVLGLSYPELGPLAEVWWPVEAFSMGLTDVRYVAHSALDYAALRQDVLIEDPIDVHAPGRGEATCTATVELGASAS
ncbi:MAG: hypothetical protein R3B40_13875 [Polyangiales bacterium]|nr:hypothetical protein [Myxococcales bacterium]MCB9659806.1 hypothetical protein [Sandaracinaceae bacterium]